MCMKRLQVRLMPFVLIKRHTYTSEVKEAKVKKKWGGNYLRGVRVKFPPFP